MKMNICETCTRLEPELSWTHNLADGSPEGYPNQGEIVKSGAVTWLQDRAPG